MSKLKIGAVVLSIWSVLNFFPSLYVGISILFLGKHPPGLYAIITEEEIVTLSPDMLATIDSIGLFANFSLAALSLLMLIVIWRGLVKKLRWAYWALLIAASLGLIAGIAADYAVHFAFPEVNMFSALVLAVGFVLSGLGLFRSHN